MAAEKPPIDSFFVKPSKPPIDTFFVGDGRTSIVKNKQNMALNNNPFLPVKDDIPGLVSSVAHGVTMGVTDVGREPLSRIRGGYPGEMAERGMRIAKDLPGYARSFAIEGPSGPMKRALSEELETPEDYGFPVAPQPRSVLGKIGALGIEMGTSALMGKGIERGVRSLAPKAQKAGVRMVRGMIKPTGEFAEKGDELSEALLKEGVVRGGKENILQNVQDLSKKLNNEIDDILEMYKGRKISPQKAIEYMDEVKANYVGNAATDEVLNKVDDVKRTIIQRHQLTEPVYGDVEKGQFVMGPASKQVSPKMRTIDTRKVPIESKMKSLKKHKAGGFWGKAGERRIVSPSDYLENPEDVVALHRPGRRMKAISPEETYNIRPETKGPSIKERVVVGEKPRAIGVKNAQKFKKGQYQVSYDSDAMTPERTTRRAYARALKEGIEQAIPEADIAGKNRRIGDLAEAAQILAKRLGVSERNALMNLGDMVLIGTAPKVAIARKLLSADKITSMLARNLYDAPNKARSLKNLPQITAGTQGARRFLTYTE